MDKFRPCPPTTNGGRVAAVIKHSEFSHPVPNDSANSAHLPAPKKIHPVECKDLFFLHVRPNFIPTSRVSPSHSVPYYPILSPRPWHLPCNWVKILKRRPAPHVPVRGMAAGEDTYCSSRIGWVFKSLVVVVSISAEVLRHVHASSSLGNAWPGYKRLLTSYINII